MPNTPHARSQPHPPALPSFCPSMSQCRSPEGLAQVSWIVNYIQNGSCLSCFSAGSAVSHHVLGPRSFRKHKSSGSSCLAQAEGLGMGDSGSWLQATVSYSPFSVGATGLTVPWSPWSCGTLPVFICPFCKGVTTPPPCTLRQDLTSLSSAFEHCPAWDPPVDTAHCVLRHKHDLWEERRGHQWQRAPSGILAQIALGGRG